MTLPDELYPIILSYIWDFALWRDARYVSHRWYKIIIEIQPQLIWRFVHAGQLPNGMRHGYVGNWLENYINHYDIFRYDKLIAREALTDKHIIGYNRFDSTGLINFSEFYASTYHRHTLGFLLPNHEGIILEFHINNQLNLYAIHINGRPITLVRN